MRAHDKQYAIRLEIVKIIQKSTDRPTLLFLFLITNQKFCVSTKNVHKNNDKFAGKQHIFVLNVYTRSNAHSR